MAAQSTKLGRTGVAIACAGALVACTSSPDPTPTPTSTDAELRIVTNHTPEPSGMEALLNGSLATDDEGCVFAQTRDTRVTLVWPDGYSVRGDSASYEVVDGDGVVIAKSGEELAIGGGGGTTDDSWGNADCIVGEVWIVGAVSRA